MSGNLFITLIGVCLAALGVLLDLLFPYGRPGFGPFQMTLIVIGLFCIVAGRLKSMPNVKFAGIIKVLGVWTVIVTIGLSIAEVYARYAGDYDVWHWELRPSTSFTETDRLAVFNQAYVELVLQPQLRRNRQTQ